MNIKVGIYDEKLGEQIASTLGTADEQLGFPAGALLRTEGPIWTEGWQPETLIINTKPRRFTIHYPKLVKISGRRTLYRGVKADENLPPDEQHLQTVFILIDHAY